MSDTAFSIGDLVTYFGRVVGRVAEVREDGWALVWDGRVDEYRNPVGRIDEYPARLLARAK